MLEEREMIKIHEFDPQIYPCKLWVAITTECKTLSERFEWKYDGTEIDIDFENTCVQVDSIIEKSKSELVSKMMKEISICRPPHYRAD